MKLAALIAVDNGTNGYHDDDEPTIQEMGAMAEILPVPSAWAAWYLDRLGLTKLTPQEIVELNREGTPA